MVGDWITWIIVVLSTCISWLTSVQIMGVPVLFIIGATFILGVMIRAFLFKP